MTQSLQRKTLAVAILKKKLRSPVVTLMMIGLASPVIQRVAGRDRHLKAVADGDDDWLSLGATGTRETKRDSQSRGRSPDKSTSNTSDDWLGLGKETKEDLADDDWLSATLKIKKESRSSSAGDDWP